MFSQLIARQNAVETFDTQMKIVENGGGWINSIVKKLKCESVNKNDNESHE